MAQAAIVPVDMVLVTYQHGATLTQSAPMRCRCPGAGGRGPPWVAPFRRSLCECGPPI